MKFNIKKNGIYSFALATAVSLTACTGDLNVTPIDPNLDTPEKMLLGTLCKFSRRSKWRSRY